jgi:5-formyltetrahydrofolate cyclo-ligase
MLGFDASLHRIGYGGGYYDRFLADQPKAKKIGVCYEVSKVGKIPAEPHDVPLDFIVSESHTYTP